MRPPVIDHKMRALREMVPVYPAMVSLSVIAMRLFAYDPTQARLTSTLDKARAQARRYIDRLTFDERKVVEVESCIMESTALNFQREGWDVPAETYRERYFAFLLEDDR